MKNAFNINYIKFTNVAVIGTLRTKILDLKNSRYSKWSAKLMPNGLLAVKTEKAVFFFGPLNVEAMSGDLDNQE